MSSNINLVRLWCDQRAVSAIEFALIAPILAMLMLGAYDFGNAAMQQIQLQEAVRAGGGYAVNWPTDVAGIQNAVASALPAGWVLTNTGDVAAVACSCLDPSDGTATNLAGCDTGNFDTCAANSGLVISINATMAYTAIDTLYAKAIEKLSATYVTRFQ
jgi:Flp pilus assembly protein TadG